jgi:hypothetical protein
MIFRTPTQNFIKKFPVAIEILHFSGYIQKLKKIQKSEPFNLIFLKFGVRDQNFLLEYVLYSPNEDLSAIKKLLRFHFKI